MAMTSEEENRILRQCVMLLRDPCNEFIRKVEAGEAHSVRSYSQMKGAVTRVKELLNGHPYLNAAIEQKDLDLSTPINLADLPHHEELELERQERTAGMSRRVMRERVSSHSCPSEAEPKVQVEAELRPKRYSPAFDVGRGRFTEGDSCKFYWRRGRQDPMSWHVGVIRSIYQDGEADIECTVPVNGNLMANGVKWRFIYKPGFSPEIGCRPW